MKILAIGCHPDDLELHCYGTLAKCIDRGDEVYVCGVTAGEHGHYIIKPKELAEIRKKEAEAAAKIIGAKEYVNLEGPDADVYRRDMKLLYKMIDYIRKVDPDLIITHYHEDYSTDHVETSHLVYNAAFLASLPHYQTETSGEDFKPAKGVIPIYYMDAVVEGVMPITNYVDISDYMHKKEEALKCHQSQLVWLKEHDGIDIVQYSAVTDMAHGRYASVKAAEVFSMCPFKGRNNGKNLLP